MTGMTKSITRNVVTTLLAASFATALVYPASAGVFGTLGDIAGGAIKKVGRAADGLAGTAGRTAKKIFDPDPPRVQEPRGSVTWVDKKAKTPLEKLGSRMPKKLDFSGLNEDSLTKYCLKKGMFFAPGKGCIKWE